jgi:hypothetical protein
VPDFSATSPIALGHKRTFCDVQTMSALPPIADIGPDGFEIVPERCTKSTHQENESGYFYLM